MRLIHHNSPTMTPPTPTTLRQHAKKWAFFTLRWGIAVVGIWWVISQITWRDKVNVLGRDNRPIEERLIDHPEPRDLHFNLTDGRVIPRDLLVNKADQKKVLIREADGPVREVELLGLRLNDANKVEGLLIARETGGQGQWITPDKTVGYELKVPWPLVERGVGRMMRDAGSGIRPWLLVLSLVIFPVTYIVTSIRWHKLLKVLDIDIPLARAFVLNMVGAFYNTFMPGSTGGDVLKAYYASKQTSHRTRAVMSVFVDRIIGLLALIVLGGTMALYQFLTGPSSDQATWACGNIAAVSGMIIGGTLAFFFVFYKPTLRRYSGLGWFISKLPKQKQIQNAIQTLEIYRKRKALMIGALVMTFPVHITVVLSAMFAGNALGLTISPLYYFVAVPVIVLVGAIPISPQGAGVMEAFAILLVRAQGGSVSQAFALTMCIRVVQMLWNLTGGVLVLRGGYHKPDERERSEMNEDIAEAKAA